MQVTGLIVQGGYICCEFFLPLFKPIFTPVTCYKDSQIFTGVKRKPIAIAYLKCTAKSHFEDGSSALRNRSVRMDMWVKNKGPSLVLSDSDQEEFS